jgi:hypothetical protein
MIITNKGKKKKKKIKKKKEKERRKQAVQCRHPKGPDPSLAPDTFEPITNKHP